MRFMKLGLVVVAATTALVVGSGSVAAANPPGRAASTRGLAEAAGAVTTGGARGNERLTEQMSLNFTRATDPETPGVQPPGGDPTP